MPYVCIFHIYLTHSRPFVYFLADHFCSHLETVTVENRFFFRSCTNSALQTHSLDTPNSFWTPGAFVLTPHFARTGRLKYALHRMVPLMSSVVRPRGFFRHSTEMALSPRRERRTPAPLFASPELYQPRGSIPLTTMLCRQRRLFAVTKA